MKNRMILLMAALALAFVAAGCSGTANVNVAGNRMSTSNSNTTVSNMNRGPDNSMAGNTNMAAKPAPMSDTDFMREAAIGGMEEVELGRLAGSKATAADVKNFGQMMVTDHSKANNELKSLAAKKNIQLPTELDPKHKGDVDGLKAKSGADFDKAYVDAMLEDHEKDVAAFEEKSQNATDPDLKAFATKTLPTLRKHLDAIRAISSKMK